MEFVAIIVLAALVFGACFLVDKGFTKVFRSQAQHISGKAVRLNKRYGSIGIVIAVIGLAAIFTGIPESLLLIIGGSIMVLMGVGLVVYYMGYGVFYDEDSFIFMTLGKRTATYYYRDIRSQQLYNNQGHLLIELYMADGKAVQLQSTMNGCFEFMDQAFAGWLKQTGRTRESCPWYDPDNSCWFPPADGEV